MTRKPTNPKANDRETALAALDAALSGEGQEMRQADADHKHVIPAQPLTTGKTNVKQTKTKPAKTSMPKLTKTRANTGKFEAAPNVKVMPMDVSTEPGVNFAAVINELLAKKAPSKSITVKAVVVKYYTDILRGRLGGISHVDIAPALSRCTGIDIKHGTLRNYFQSIAATRGDIPRVTRINGKAQ